MAYTSRVVIRPLDFPDGCFGSATLPPFGGSVILAVRPRTETSDSRMAPTGTAEPPLSSPPSPRCRRSGGTPCDVSRASSTIGKLDALTRTGNFACCGMSRETTWRKVQAIKGRITEPRRSGPAEMMTPAALRTKPGFSGLLGRTGAVGRNRSRNSRS
jgi:hypothetical protein